jgi:hypothetical protein
VRGSQVVEGCSRNKKKVGQQSPGMGRGDSSARPIDDNNYLSEVNKLSQLQLFPYQQQQRQITRFYRALLIRSCQNEHSRHVPPMVAVRQESYFSSRSAVRATPRWQFVCLTRVMMMLLFLYLMMLLLRLPSGFSRTRSETLVGKADPSR